MENVKILWRELVHDATRNEEYKGEEDDDEEQEEISWDEGILVKSDTLDCLVIKSRSFCLLRPVASAFQFAPNLSQLGEPIRMLNDFSLFLFPRLRVSEAEMV
jgi:hypothetical protein